MPEKINFKNFFIKFKKVIVGCGVFIFTLVLIGIVALNSTGNLNNKLEGDDVNTVSNPTKITFVMPVKDGVVIKDFSSTALKFNSTLKQWEAHKAIDIKGSNNASVLAVYDGEIVSVENTYLMGTTVTIKHNKSLVTIYSSLDPQVSVKAGDIVKKGDVIGKVSDSAKSESKDGPHLHFEVRLDNVKVDPNLYLEGFDK